MDRCLVLHNNVFDEVGVLTICISYFTLCEDFDKNAFVSVDAPVNFFFQRKSLSVKKENRKWSMISWVLLDSVHFCLYWFVSVTIEYYTIFFFRCYFIHENDYICWIFLSAWLENPLVVLQVEEQ